MERATDQSARPAPAIRDGAEPSQGGPRRGDAGAPRPRREPAPPAAEDGQSPQHPAAHRDGGRDRGRSGLLPVEAPAGSAFRGVQCDACLAPWCGPGVSPAGLRGLPGSPSRFTTPGNRFGGRSGRERRSGHDGRREPAGTDPRDLDAFRSCPAGTRAGPCGWRADRPRDETGSGPWPEPCARHWQADQTLSSSGYQSTSCTSAASPTSWANFPGSCVPPSRPR